MFPLEIQANVSTYRKISSRSALGKCQKKSRVICGKANFVVTFVVIFSAVRAAGRDLRTLIDSSLNTVPTCALYSVISHDIETT